MPLIKKDIFACYGGGGDAITFIGGAESAVSSIFNVMGNAGVSAGAFVAAKNSFNVDNKHFLDCLKDIFSGQVFRLSADSFQRGGILDWNVLGEAVDKLIGKGATLGDAFKPLVIGATNLDRGEPIYFSKKYTPKVLVREALMASSSFMGLITPAIQVPSFGTVLSPDIRLFSDGGWTDNTCDHAWDQAYSAGRIFVRLKSDNSVHRVRKGDVLGIHSAVFRSSLYAANLIKSRRNDGIIIDLPFANKWDFLKSPDQVENEFSQGYGATIYQESKKGLPP
jgi:hypothetical protein